MDKEKCGHCGEYGFQDGYSHPMRICRISGCVDADECSNKLKENLAGKGKDYLMAIFRNKEKGIQERDNEGKIRDFEEKEKLRIAKEKMEADEKTKKEAAEVLKERAKKVGLPETATEEEVVTKEKEVIPPNKEESTTTEKKEETVTPNPLDEEKVTVLVERKVYDDQCPHCNTLVREKEVYSDDDGKTLRHSACKGKIKITERPKVEEKLVEKPEEKPEEKPKVEETVVKEEKPKEEEVKPEEKKE
jgi:DNA-directed RNA polymerase-3 subunit RPC5